MPEDVPAPLRLVVVGAGPKALFALEQLTALLEEAATGAVRSGTARRGLEVTVLDPAATPGTGAAYAPDQPHVLRLNVSTRLLDAAAGGAFPSFEQWRGNAAPSQTAEASPVRAAAAYPPRAVVGEYLGERWQGMLARLEHHARCRHVHAVATAIEQDDAGWRVTLRRGRAGAGTGEAASPSGLDEVLSGIDELLVATGHGAGHDGALAARWSSPLPLRPAVLPVPAMLSLADVPPGSRVALRGAALTFLDAALALTEGRGAEFGPSPERPGALLHRRSPQEPATLLPTARHGLLLDAKPDPGTAAAVPRSAALVDGARRLGALDPADPEVVRRALGVLVQTSAALLAERAQDPERPDRAAAHRRRLSAVEQTLSGGAEPDLPTGPGRAEEALRRSVAVARGERAPGPAWALGRAWARLYPQLTTLLRGSTLEIDRWVELRAAAQVLERFAFGPPVETAQKLLAMIASGAVDLSWVDAGTAITAAGPRGLPPGAAGPDLVIDAVLAPPGLRHLTDPLARQLLAGGTVSVREGRRGAAVAPDGTALGADGERREGLALLGRPTEDHVIGHDTLDRHLHGEGEQWAARLAALVTAPPLPAPRPRPDARLPARSPGAPR